MIRIVPVKTRADLKAFVRLPWKLYASDAHWVPPLILERLHSFSDKNPFFKHARWQCWLAFQEQNLVGRISAQIDNLHQDRYGPGTGFFGLLEGKEDKQVFQALLGTAEEWLRSQGMACVQGPFNLSVNQECGLLVEGFDTPPMVMMGHALPYYGTFLEQHHYHKVQDLLAYQIDIHFKLPPGVTMFLNKAKGSMRIRPMRRSHFREDLNIIKEIFEEAWSENWGFLPFTDEEFSEIGQQLKFLVEDDFVQIAEIDGQACAMLVAFPNIHEILKGLNGRLFPWGWVKLLWGMKVAYPKTARVALMGVRKPFQSTPMGAAMAYGMIEAVRGPGLRKGIQSVELSWILESNKRMSHILESLGARPYKVYRLYQKALV